MKIVKWSLLVVVLLIIIAGLVGYFSLNGIVRRTVQSQSEKSLNLPTTLAGANVSLFGGHLTLNDYKVGNPAGYGKDNMLSLDSINVNVSYGQLRQEPIRVQSIEIKGPRLLLERNGTQLNVQAAMEQMPKTEPAEPSKPMKVIIDNLTVSNAQVVIKPAIPGLPEEYTLTIPTVSLSNIGSGEGAENGAAIKEVVMLLTTTLAAKAAESEQLPPELRQLLSLDVGQLTQALQAKFNVQVQKLADDLAKKLPPGVGNLVEDAAKNPEEVLKDPGKTLQRGLDGLIPRAPKAPATQPAGEK